jgi:Skp family chaperone for outer membrane proteins
MRKKIFCTFLFLLALTRPDFSSAEILVNIGILDLTALSELYPEAKTLVDEWKAIKAKKHYWLALFEDQLKITEEEKLKPTPLTLSERLNLGTRALYLNKQLELLTKKSDTDLKNLQQKQSSEIKKKIFLALRIRRKKGFGIVLSASQQMILFADESLDMNPAVIEELVPVKTK